MKAIDFIRVFGWIEAKIFVEDNISFGDVYDAEMDKYRSVETNLFDLKQYIDAWKLVNKFGGLVESRKYIDDRILPELSRAIQLVESVENNNEC